MRTSRLLFGTVVLAAIASSAPRQNLVPVLPTAVQTPDRPTPARGPASAQPNELGFLLSGTQTANFNWNVTDSAGFNWDIQHDGAVASGTNGAYSGGMRLMVNNFALGWPSQGVLSEDKREVQIGPCLKGTLRIWRRICVPSKTAFCRWIDIFENSSSSEQTLKVHYETNVGGSIAVQGISGEAFPSKGDWCFLTNEAPARNPNKPALVHVIADKGSRVMPHVQAGQGGSFTIAYDFDLTVPAGKTVALCLFESQQKSAADAAAFMKKFRPAAELASIPPELRRIIVNIHGGALIAGDLELPRDGKLDLAVLREGGNEIMGTIQREQFAVETSFGRVELPAKRVVGLAAETGADAWVRVALADGQIVCGKLLGEPLKMTLENGTEMVLPADRISTLAYRVSPEKPDQAALNRPTILTRSGQRLFFKPSDVSYSFLTECGTLDLRAEDLSAIQMDTPECGLHRAVFRNGSVLAGLLLAKDIKTSLELGPRLSCAASAVSQFVFPGESPPAGGLAQATMKNDDVLAGRLAQETLEVKTAVGVVKVARDDLSELKLTEGSMDQVEIKLFSGASVTGRLVGQKIRFQIVPGPELPLFVGRVVKIICPRPVSQTSVPAAPSTAPSSTSVPAKEISGMNQSPDGKTYYIVQDGDKGFWPIAQKVYGDGRKWDIICKANPSVDPTNLVVGIPLVIPQLESINVGQGR